MEIVYCRQEPTPEECEDGEHTYDPEEPNFPISSFEVKMSEEGENAGRGIFTKVDIPEDAYLSAETSCHPVRFMPRTKKLIEDLEDDELDSRIVPVEVYMVGSTLLLPFLLYGADSYRIALVVFAAWLWFHQPTFRKCFLHVVS